jgi:hypothetical protein
LEKNEALTSGWFPCAQIDSERRKDVDTSNEKRAQFNAREAEIRVSD